jgi:hypothetical protein
MPESSTAPEKITKPKALATNVGVTKTTTDFNITLQLGDDVENVVTLYASDLSNVAKEGMTFELPEGKTVSLGTLKKLLEWFNKAIPSANIPTEADKSWPEALKAILNGVLNVETKVTRFRFRQPPQDATGKYPDPEFKLALTGTAMDPDNLEVAKPIPFGGIFSVVGGGIGIERTNTSAVVVG